MPQTFTPALAETLNTVLSGLMRRYQERVPDVKKILTLMQEAGMINSMDDIENDHIAFRTMGVPQLGVASFEKIFLHLGYKKKAQYHFPAKRLDAWWYSPPLPQYPRIFVSELRVHELDPKFAKIIRSYTDEVTSDPVDALDLNDGAAIDKFLHRGLWRLPTLADFNALQTASEYASWVIYNRYYLNHFTISVHNLPREFQTIEKFNTFLKHHGVKLNDSAGERKISGDGKLIQSSSVAELVQGEFADGHGGIATKLIPGSYVEFAERLPLAEYEHLPAAQLKREHRRDGFEISNADKIFESTYTQQTAKRDASA